MAVQFILQGLSQADKGWGGLVQRQPLPAFVVFQVLTAQNKQHINVSYFGVLHWQRCLSQTSELEVWGGHTWPMSCDSDSEY